jgi:hypothetical protein
MRSVSSLNTHQVRLHSRSSIGLCTLLLALIAVAGSATSFAASKPTITSFTAAPAIMVYGGSSKLTWTTTGATVIAITPGTFKSLSASGSFTVEPTATTTYTLTATNSAGSVESTTTVTVSNPQPITSFTASPVSIKSGASSTLTWTTTGATGIAITPGTFNSTSASGSTTVTPTATTTYTLTATSSAGSAQAAVTVTVTKPPAIASFTASPASILTGSSSTLTWKTTGATLIAITPGTFKTFSGDGSLTIKPTASTTYTLTATDSTGSVNATTPVTVTLPPPLMVTTTSCPGGTQNTAYAGCTIAATGGVPPYQFTIDSSGNYPPLPEGMALDASTGAITAPIIGGMGAYTPNIIVTDSAGAQASAQITFSINGSSTFMANIFPSTSIFHHRVDVATTSLPVDNSPAAPIYTGYQSETVKPFFGNESGAPFPNGIPAIEVPYNQPDVAVSTTVYQSYFTSGPIPAYAPVEGTSFSNGDRHVLVYVEPGTSSNPALYEMWQGIYEGGPWTDSSNALWPNVAGNNLTEQGNGTSDAAGLPVAPLLVNADEVIGTGTPTAPNGVVMHPVRFTLNHMLNYWVWPGTETAGVGSCTLSSGASIPTESEISQSSPPKTCSMTGPAGEIYRLKASVATPACAASSPQAAIIITGFRDYGIILADNGMSGGLIGTPDARWNDNDLECITSLTLADFEPVNVSSLMVSNDSGQTVSTGTTSQTIAFSNPGAQTVGTPLSLSATASSGLTVSFSAETTSVCTVSGTTATFLIAGTCTIEATQPGNATYAPAAAVSQSFTVNASGGDPTVGVLPSYNDTYANWKNAGMALAGGIPDRTTICATVNPLGSGQDDYTDIQNAINNCPAGEVVQLAAGAFSIKLADMPIYIGTGISLRGTGACTGASSPYCQTSISVMDGALAYTGGMCGTSTSAEVACPNGGEPEVLIAPVVPDYNYSWGTCGNVGANLGTDCGATALAADAAQGQTTVQVASTSGFAVGSWVLIDEASGAGWVADPMNQWTANGSVWAASDWLSASGSPATGRVLWSKAENNTWDFGSSEYPYQASSTGCWYSYCDRVTSELHKIASIGAGPCPGSNCTLTFDDPLTIAFRQSGGHSAQVYAKLYGNNSGSGTPISFLQEAGVENISLLRSPEGGLEMELCVNCWVKNTEVGDWYGGGISMAYSARSELNTVYVHHCWDSVNNGGEYPLALDSASTEMLITNSITNFGGKGMVARAGGAGSVISYNYIDDTMYDAESGIGDYWVDMGINASHYSGPHHVLFEGNWGDDLDNDNTHGNSIYMTFFRNLGSGFRSPFTDPSVGGLVDDAAGKGYYCPSGLASCVSNPPGPLRAAGPMAYNYWFAYVGNVLGTSGKSTAANGWTYSGDFTASRIFMLGWDGGNGGQDPNLDGKSGSYILINGNYDYLNDGVTWQGSPVALPNSFYLSTKPAFFAAGSGYPWPWVTPVGSQQIQNGPTGCGGTCSGLPAQARWQAGTPFAQP